MSEARPEVAEKGLDPFRYGSGDARRGIAGESADEGLEEPCDLSLLFVEKERVGRVENRGVEVRGKEVDQVEEDRQLTRRCDDYRPPGRQPAGQREGTTASVELHSSSNSSSRNNVRTVPSGSGGSAPPPRALACRPAAPHASARGNYLGPHCWHLDQVFRRPARVRRKLEPTSGGDRFRRLAGLSRRRLAEGRYVHLFVHLSVADGAAWMGNGGLKRFLMDTADAAERCADLGERVRSGPTRIARNRASGPFLNLASQVRVLRGHLQGAAPEAAGGVLSRLGTANRQRPSRSTAT